MKAYQKAEMIAKNLPTGPYVAGCPKETPATFSGVYYHGCIAPCKRCMVSQ